MIKKSVQNLAMWGTFFATSLASAGDGDLPGAKSLSQPYTANSTSEKLQLTNIKDFPLSENGQAKNFFLISNKWSPRYALELKSSLGKEPGPLDEAKTPAYAEARIQCDSDVTIFTESLINSRKTGKDISFRLYNSKSQGGVQYLLPSPQVENCTLSFRSVDNPQLIGAVRLTNIDRAFPVISSLNAYREECHLPRAQENKKIQQMFLTTKYKNHTCPSVVESIEPLEDPEEGFQAKVEALLGQKIPDHFLKNQDPFAPLDFRKAPKLDAIYVASLVFRNDFYGNVIARLLKYHADRGTLVQIEVSDILQSKKDQNLLYKISRENGNIRLKEYRYNSPKGVIDELNEFHRDYHIKILATLSQQNPAHNVIITGGRNIHDGFLFKSKPDYSRWPEMTQYGIDESFVHWSDFEMRIQSQNFTRRIFSHLQTVWNQDAITQAFDSINKDLEVTRSVDSNYFTGPLPLIRHLVSIPFRDQMALEKYYVDMIDHAQFEIKLSSPYLRPTDAITAALDRAIKRGVDITIQTRIDLSGDTLDWLYTEMNKESINKFKDRVKLYEWTGNSILHSKFMLIDDELAFIGSVNISRRSFVHDIESGFLIYSRDYTQRMEKIFDNYTAVSHRVTEKQKRKLFPSILIKIFENEF